MRRADGLEPLRFLQHLRMRLARETTPTYIAFVSYEMKNPELLDLLPHYWREEAKTVPEWWIRYARSIGVHGWYDILKDMIVFRLTKDAADEATITWPGKQN